MKQIEQVTRTLIEPLNDTTKRLLSPIKFMLNDRLRVELDDEGKRFILDFYGENRDGSRTWPSSCAKTFLRRIPERRKASNSQFDFHFEKWIVGGTDFTAILINNLWPPDQVTFTKEAKVFYSYLLYRFLQQTNNSLIKAAYKLKGEVPKLPDDFVDHPIRPLLSYQKTCLATQIFQEGSNEWMEQGTGKTPIIISRVCYEAHRIYQKEKRMYRALIVVPKNMRINWRNRFMDFATRSGKLTILRGGKLTRVKLMIEAFKKDKDSEFTAIICSYDAVIRSWDALQMIEWDLVTLDEAHMIKSPSTQRWKKLKKLRDLSKCRAGLTGTPIANNLFDAWTQLEWLGEGLSGFMSYKSFKAYYGRFVSSNGDRQREILTGYQNLPILQERFSRLCFMITLKEALPELPEETYDILEVEMTKYQRDCYVSLQKQLAIEIESEMKDERNKQLTATHILTKLLRLSQITSGYLRWDTQINEEGEILNASSIYEEISPNPKIDIIVDLLKSKSEKEKTIIWTNWVAVIKMLDKRLTTEDIKHVIYYGGTSDKDREIAQDSFNENPEVKVFIGNPAAGGLGLDLWGHIPEWDDTEKDHGCNTTQEIYYSQSWSMIHRSQSQKRAIRKGTRVSVRITDLIVPQTIDEEIAIRVLNKQIVANKLQDVKNIMARILNSIPTIGEDNA